MSAATATTTDFEPVIGIEVHCQLSTATKMFCRCKVAYGAAPNTLTCPVCEGLPGALPTINRKGVEYAIRIGLALHCEVAKHTKFDRKNYFYPDLPKGYQISQYDEPINSEGWIEIPLIDESTGEFKKVGIERAHLEEDSGKSIHMDAFSLVDLNRAGTALVEVVTKPDMHSPEEAYLYLTTLKRNLSYLGVSSLSMDKGSLRCDLNISLRKQGETGLPPYKVEVKNLNSFANSKAALEYEIKRQTQMLLDGETPAVETRLWDATLNETRAMRSKELANDYRYFPEPDLPELFIDEAWVEEIRQTLPEMPDERLARFKRDYELKDEDAAAIIDGGLPTAEFFEEAVKLLNKPQKIANWMIGEMGRAQNHHGKDFEDFELKPKQLVEMINLLEDGKLNNITAKEVFAALLDAQLESGEEQSPEAIAKKLNKLIEQDSGEIEATIAVVIEEFPQAVEDFKAGKKQSIGFLVGQCMRKLKGKANPKELAPLIEKQLGDA